jgi:predicted small secreted protein
MSVLRKMEALMSKFIEKVQNTKWITLATILLVGGCATIEGAGKDIEAAGEAVQEAADSE